jgi:hypothetical protein
VRALRLWTAAAAAPAVAAGFYLLAALRSKRSLHPTGVGYRGWLVVGDDHPGRPEVPLFRPGTARPALLRFSRGAGLPEPLPDALGVAVKLPDAYGPGNDQDLLLTSSTDRPLLRRLLFPATSFVRGTFSTALPYELGGKRVVLLLVPAHTGGASSAGTGIRRGGGALAELNATAGGLRFELRTASSFGPSQPVATLTTGQPLPAEQTEALRFNHGPPGRVFDQPAGSTSCETPPTKQANAAGRADHRRCATTTDLRLRLELRGDWLHLAVRDASPRLLRVVASDPHAPGGRGLWLVEQLATAWGINRHPDGGKVVWCTLKL